MANIKQIVLKAKVSPATVSRVLNDHPYVSEEKRDAVWAAVEQLDYSRNANAIHLLKGKTNRIAIMLPYVNHEYFSRILAGISEEALQENYTLVLCQTNYSREEELHVLELLKTKQVDGVIICSKTLEWEVIEQYARFGPIAVCEKSESSQVTSVYIDHYACFQTGLQY
jgi:DNA-binding LacI/PurR family transcriptional regulator